MITFLSVGEGRAIFPSPTNQKKRNQQFFSMFIAVSAQNLEEQFYQSVSVISPCFFFTWHTGTTYDVSGRAPSRSSPTVYLTLIHTKFHAMFNRPVCSSPIHFFLPCAILVIEKLHRLALATPPRHVLLSATIRIYPPIATSSCCLLDMCNMIELE